MAYRELGMVGVPEVLRRWLGGEGVRAIARAVAMDRKTIAPPMTSEAQPIRGGRLYARRFLVLAATVVVATVVALGAAELAARIVFPEWAPRRSDRVVFWVYDELLGWAHNPGQRGRLSHQDFEVSVVINSHGLRDAEYPIERTGKKRMLVLGDSFGWGFGIEVDDRFSEVVERRHPDWEIINTSVSGYGTGQQWLYLKEKGIRYQPDVVLLLFFENDFDDNVSPVSYWYNRPYFVAAPDGHRVLNTPVPQASTRQQMDRFFFGSTYFLARVYRTALTVNASVEGWSRSAPRSGPSGAMPRAPNTSKHVVTVRLLQAINDLSRDHGARFVLVSVPSAAEGRAVLREFAQNAGVSYLSLDEEFSTVTERVAFPHDGHWNARGHQIAATAIERFLTDSGIF